MEVPAEKHMTVIQGRVVKCHQNTAMKNTQTLQNSQLTINYDRAPHGL